MRSEPLNFSSSSSGSAEMSNLVMLKDCTILTGRIALLVSLNPSHYAVCSLH